MRRTATELATEISRALLTSTSPPPRQWSPTLEQTLHRLKCRDSLTPTLVAKVIDPHLINHHSLALGFFNWASQQPSYHHTSITYHSLLKSLFVARQIHSIQKLLIQARTQEVTLHPSVYAEAIRSFLSGRKAHLAFSVLHDAGRDFLDLGGDVCNSLLASLAAEIRVESARKMFDEMIARGVPLSALGLGVFLWRVCAKGGLGDVLRELDKVGNVEMRSEFDGSVVALLVVHGLCGEGRVKEADHALEELRRRGYKPDFMAYRVVAEALHKMGFVVDVEIVLKRKRKLGVAPRSGDYREFILKLVSERLLVEAKELGEVIVSGNFPIDDDVLNVLIGSVSAVDPLKSASFLRFMLEKERFPTLLTLINTGENLCKHDKADTLVEIFELLSSKEYFRDMESYNAMISLLCEARRVKEGYAILQEMRKNGFQPDVSTYNRLLEACCKEDLLQPAKRLWDEMFACGCSGNSVSYNILITKFSGVGEVDDARRLFYHMLEKGIKPTELICKSLLQGLCQKRNLETARQVFNTFVEQNVACKSSVLNAYVLCLCKEGFTQTASELLHNQADEIDCFQANVTLLKYLTDTGKLSLAAEHLKMLALKSPALIRAIHSELPDSVSSPYGI